MKKEEQIKMLLHPEEYDESQIDQMLDEANIPVPDANEEWKRFESEKTSTSHGRPSLLKIAAMFVGILMLSGIAYAAIYYMNSDVKEDVNTPTQEVTTSNSHEQIAIETPQDSIAQKPIVYENAELTTILSDIATFYHVETVYKSESAKHVRLYFTWDKTAKIEDVINIFNKFDRIHITLENQKLIVE